MKSVTFNARAEYNVLYTLQQYFPRNEAIREKKDAVRRRIVAELQKQGPGRTIPVKRIRNLSEEDFERDYLRPNIPVILEGAAADWPCTREWSFESFKRRFGDSTIKLVQRKGVSDDDLDFDYSPEYTEECNFGEFLDQVLAGGRKYMRFSPLLEKFPELAADFDKEYMTGMAHSSLGVLFHLFIGGVGTKTPLHNAMTPFVFINICGVKRWTLIPNNFIAVLNPGQADGLGHNDTKADLEAVDSEIYPGLDSIDRLEAVMQPGDLLFVPAWTWHCVKNEAPTIGVRCGMIRPTSMVSPSLTLSFIRFFVVRNPSILTVIYNIFFKKYIPEDRWLLSPRIFWRSWNGSGFSRIPNRPPG
jgi:hypothetical protein